MKRSIVLHVLACMAVAAGFSFLTGCESDDSPETSNLDHYFESRPYVSDPRSSGSPRDVKINPTAATVTQVGQEVAFKGIGGKGPYVWGVSDSSKGYMRVFGWEQAVYVTREVAPNDVIVYDQLGHAAIARINGSVSQLLVTANPTSLTYDGAKSILSAAGGSPPYTWTVASGAFGSIDSSTGSTVVYTRGAAGDNAVKVTDAVGGSASVVIRQP